MIAFLEKHKDEISELAGVFVVYAVMATGFAGIALAFRLILTAALNQ